MSGTDASTVMLRVGMRLRGVFSFSDVKLQLSLRGESLFVLVLEICDCLCTLSNSSSLYSSEFLY